MLMFLPLAAGAFFLWALQLCSQRVDEPNNKPASCRDRQVKLPRVSRGLDPQPIGTELGGHPDPHGVTDEMHLQDRMKKKTMMEIKLADIARTSVKVCWSMHMFMQVCTTWHLRWDRRQRHKSQTRKLETVHEGCMYSMHCTPLH